MSGLPLAALSGVLIVGGVLLLAYGLRRTPTDPLPRHRTTAATTWARLSRRPPGPAGRRRDLLLLGGLAGGVVVFALTGWLLALPLIPLLVVLVPWLLSAPANRDIVLLEGLDRWIRTLGATLPTGRSIADAIRASRRTAPEVIAEPVSLLIARLDDRWTSRDALFAFADDLDSPDADAVVAALVLAAHRGGTGATATLAALADSVQDRLRALREIETERAKPRAVVQQVTMITGAILIGALVIGRSFFEPYATPLGQAILAGLIAAYLGSLIALRRMTVPRRRPRILVRATDRTSADAWAAS